MNGRVTVATFDTQPDAYIAMGKLQVAGIEASLADQHLVQGDWLYAIAVGGIKLEVVEADAERAVQILNEDWSDSLD